MTLTQCFNIKNKLMKILLFNENSRVISDNQNAAYKRLSDELESLGHTVTSINTSEGNYSDCTGCWSCWLKTPGKIKNH